MAGKPNLKKSSKHRPSTSPKAAARKPAKSLKPKVKAKPATTKATPARAVASRAPSRPTRPHTARKPMPRRGQKVEAAGDKLAPRVESKAAAKIAAPPKAPSKQFMGAVHAYESGIKLMYAEEYAKAIQRFNDLIANYPDEQEIQASAKARIQACEKKLQERARTTFRSADDHYNIAVALLNSGDLQEAVTHLQQALKLAPKGDHILYALAAANALLGNKDAAVSYLKQSIQHRPENRFQAAQDDDFRAMAEEPEFKDLVAPPEK
jgi:tetratricopeptide (TPR) repeat protein